MLCTNLQQIYCPWSNSIPSQPERVFDHLGMMLHPISNHQCKLNVKHEAAKSLFFGGSFLSLFSLDFLNQKNRSLLTWLISTRLCGSQASHTYFSIRLKSFSSTLSGVQLNLVKASVVYAFSHHTFHELLFDVSKTRM